MRFLLLISLSLSAFFSYSYTIREGGRTVGAGQVTWIIESKTGISSDQIDAVLEELGKQVGYHLAYQNELQAGSFYFTNDHHSLDQDCEAKECEIQNTQGQLVNGYATMLLNRDDIEIFNLFLNKTMNEIIQSTNNYVYLNMQNEKTDFNYQYNQLPILNNAAYSAWLEVGKYNPIEDAFTSLDTCIQFREDFLELSDKHLQSEFVDVAVRERLKKLRQKALIKAEEARKRLNRRVNRVGLLQDNKDFNLTEVIFEKVSKNTDVDIDTVTKIEKLAADLIYASLKKGESIQVTGLGVFEISSQVEIVEIENKVLGSPIGEIAIDSIFTPIKWSPSSTTQIKLSNENQKQANAKVANNGGKGVCRFGQCFCSPGFQLNAEIQAGETTQKNELSGKDLLLQADEKGVDLCTEMVITQNYQTLSSILQLVESDLNDYKDSNDEQAATRVRKAMQDLKKLAQDIRAEVTNAKND